MRQSLATTFIFILSLFCSYCHAQWTEPGRIGIPGAYYYPQILASGDTLHLAGTHILEGDKVVYLRSDDAGDTWGESQILSDTANSTNAMFVRIVKNAENIMVLWRSIFDAGPGPWNIGYALSHDNGETWTEPLYILNPGWSHILYFSASGSGSVVNVVLSSRIDHDLVFFNVRSTNFGQSWSEPVELFTAAQSSMTDQVSYGDMVYYVWGGRFVWTGVYETFIISSLDNGESWSNNYMLSRDDSILSRTPSILVNRGGTVGVSWTDWKYSPYWWTGDIFYRQSSDSGFSWESEHEVTFDHLADYSDVCGIGETAHAVWENYSMGISRRNIYYRRSDDGGESWSEEYWVDGTTDDSWNPVVAASNGRVYIVWADGRDDPGMGLYFSRYEDETGIIDKGPITRMIIDLQAYPNPFNSFTTITYDGLKGGDIEIYNITGQRIRTLKIPTKDGELIHTGQVTWDARDALGNKVSSGIYFARAKTLRNSSTLKLIYLK